MLMIVYVTIPIQPNRTTYYKLSKYTNYLQYCKNCTYNGSDNHIFKLFIKQVVIKNFFQDASAEQKDFDIKLDIHKCI